MKRELSFWISYEEFLTLSNAIIQMGSFILNIGFEQLLRVSWEHGDTSLLGTFHNEKLITIGSVLQFCACHLLLLQNLIRFQGSS